MSKERLEEIIKMLIKDYGFEEASATHIAYDIKDILEEEEWGI